MNADLSQQIRDRDARKRADKGNAQPQQRAPKNAPKTPQPYEPLALGGLFDAAVRRARERKEGKELPVPAPWAPLTNALGGGFWPGLHVLVAGTGVGKSQLTLQVAEAAARAGTPIGLVELELDGMQLALRLLGEHDEARRTNAYWSNAYLGRAEPEQLDALSAAAEAMKSLPIYTDLGGAMNWSSDRLRKLVEWMRGKHPTGPLLVVVDFLQLVGAPEGEERLDLRERIGRAAYQARQLSRDFGVSIILVSSTARQNYEALSGRIDKLGLRVKRARLGGSRRVVLRPDALIGSGKESGELEYAADSVTVLLRPTLTEGAYDNVIAEILERGGRPVVAVTAKVRAGAPSWFALAFEQGRFEALPEESVDSLVAADDEGSDAAGRAPGRPRRDPDSFMRSVVEVVRLAETAGTPLKNKTAVCDRVSGTKQHTLEGIKAALRDGYISNAFGDFRTTGKPLPKDATAPAEVVQGGMTA